MLRAIIIDDEPAGIRSLQLMIEKHISNVKIVASAAAARDGITLIENYKPEIVFLDINMPGLNGFEMLDELVFRDFQLVFTTAHHEFAIQAIKHHAFDYLLKPVDLAELQSCISRIEAEASKTENQQPAIFSNLIGISVKDGIIFIRQSEIIRLEASGSYTVFYLDHKVKHLASKPMKEYEPQLNPQQFFRCHNSHIVNLNKVVKFSSSNGFFAQMTDGSEADIARKNKDAFLERLRHISS